MFGGCTSAKYQQNIVIKNNELAVQGEDNIFSYDYKSGFEYKTVEDIERENGINVPDIERYASKFTFAGLGENVMPIVGYIEPEISDPEFTVSLQDAMKDFALSGCNIMNCIHYQIGRDEITDMMNYSVENGTMMLLKWGGINNLHNEPDEEAAANRIYTDLNSVYRMKSFAGINVADEPGYLQWTGNPSVYGTAIKYFRNVFNSKMFYVNLLPIYSPSWAFPNGATNPETSVFSTDYEYYYDSYFEKVSPQVAIYDYYPLIGAFPGLKNQYFYQMSLIKDRSDAAGIPFWTYIQVADWGGTRDATYSEIAWQVNTSLAFGAKGINYYTYNYAQNHTNTMIAKDGSKNRSYYDVQKVNRHIANVDEWMLNANFKAVIQYGITPNGETFPTSFNVVKKYKSIKSTSGVPHIIGCMDYYENNIVDDYETPCPKELYYIVNDSIDKNGQIVVNFENKVKGTYKCNGETVRFEKDSLIFDLRAGEAVAVLLEV